jgi:asparagine synthase (glutamine-hydrolysing)
VSQALGTDHHELELSVTDAQVDLAQLSWQMDEPLADLSSLGFLPLCELASQHVTVALTGQGADELFGGYRKHRVASLTERWNHLPALLRNPAAAAIARAGGRGGRMAEALQAADPVARVLATSGFVRPDLRGDIFGGALADYAGAAETVLRDRLAGAPGAAPLEAALYMDARLGLVDDMLTYFDRASMACSLEVRVPFLDHELVELAATIPTGHKVRRLQGKHVLRLAAKGRVPDFVLQKRKRGFFNEAVSTWMAADDASVVRRLLLKDDPAYAAIVDPGTVRKAVTEWRGGRAEHSNLLLGLVMLELWMTEYLPRAKAPALEAVA